MTAVGSFEELDRAMTPASLAIAGVGQTGMGRLFLSRVVQYGFKGPVYPLHPAGGEALGLKVYPNVNDVPGPVDYVVSCVSAPRVPQLIVDCATKGVRAVCVFTAGYSETGTAEGRQLEEDLVRLARATGVRVIGPNCMGVFCPKAGLSVASDAPREQGRVGLICQSGGNAMYLIRAAGDRGIRFSKAVSYGNACDLDETELLEYFTQDGETDMVAAYVEGVKDGRRFLGAVKRLAAEKPFVVLKGGHTAAGTGAAASHTGALAGSDSVWDSLLEQIGAIRVHTLDEMVDMMVTFQFMPVPGGRRLVVFGVGGGATVLTTDDCSALGFTFPPLPADVRQELHEAVGGDAGNILGNPVDIPPMVGTNEGYQRLLRRMLGWDGVDLLLYQLPFRGIMLKVPLAHMIFGSQMANVVRVAGEGIKPVAVVIHYLATGEGWREASTYVRQAWESGLPAYYSAASAARAIDRLLRYHERMRTGPPSPDG